MDLRDIIPGYSDELDKESVVRDAALLGLSENIGPFPVRSMTLRDYLALKRHPMLCGKFPTVGELVVFIRFLWTGNKGTILNAPARWLFGRRCFKHVKANYADIHYSCISYVDETLTDSVSAKGNWNPPYYSEGIMFISLLSRHNHFTPEYTMSLPMKSLLQYKKEIEHVSGGTPVNRSDRKILDYTTSINRN